MSQASARTDKLAAQGGGVVFCGIFLNEAETIVQTLDSCREVLDCVAFLDTGATDGTPDLVRKWLSDNGVPGVVYTCPWPELAKALGLRRRKNGETALFDFARARNLAQALALNHCPKPEQWWLLEADGRWLLQGPVDGVRDALAETPQRCTAYDLAVRQPGSSLDYLRLRRASECGPGKWQWQHALHEQLWRTDDATVGSMGGVHFWHEAEPNEQRRWRWERDLLVLEEMLEQAHEDLAAAPESAMAKATVARILFYRAQTYDCLDMYPEALAAYLERDKVQGSANESGVAMFRAGRLAYRLKKYADAEKYWIKAHAYYGRPEPLWALAELCAEQQPAISGSGKRSQHYARLAFECSQRVPIAKEFADPRAWALARFGPAADNLEVTAREAHLRLLVGA